MLTDVMLRRTLRAPVDYAFGSVLVVTSLLRFGVEARREHARSGRTRTAA